MIVIRGLPTRIRKTVLPMTGTLNAWLPIHRLAAVREVVKVKLVGVEAVKSRQVSKSQRSKSVERAAGKWEKNREDLLLSLAAS
jgi:hypothetical protein